MDEEIADSSAADNQKHYVNPIDDLKPFISLIIPAHNEEKYIGSTLQSVARALEAFSTSADGPGVEVIVVDNDSTDSTARIAAAEGARVVIERERRIASVRNAGARVARAGILAFLDADSLVSPGIFSAVLDAMSSGRYAGGGTRVKLDRNSAGIFCTYCITTIPARWLLGVTGGLIFTWKETFERLGGFDQSLYCGEDMKFILCLRKAARTEGKKFKIITNESVTSSARAFNRFGDWYYFRNLPHLLLKGRKAFSDREFSRRFWYQRY